MIRCRIKGSLSNLTFMGSNAAFLFGESPYHMYSASHWVTIMHLVGSCYSASAFSPVLIPVSQCKLLRGKVSSAHSAPSADRPCLVVAAVCGPRLGITGRRMRDARTLEV